MGLEPILLYWKRILSPLRLPFRHGGWSAARNLHPVLKSHNLGFYYINQPLVVGTVRIALTPVVFQTTVQTTRRCTHMLAFTQVLLESRAAVNSSTKNIFTQCKAYSVIRSSFPSWCLRVDSDHYFIASETIASAVGLRRHMTLGIPSVQACDDGENSATITTIPFML